MKINEDKIKKDYGSIVLFCQTENISLNVYYSLRGKTTNSFQRGKGEKSWNAFKKLEKLNYIIEENVAWAH